MVKTLELQYRKDTVLHRISFEVERMDVKDFDNTKHTLGKIVFEHNMDLIPVNGKTEWVKAWYLWMWENEEEEQYLLDNKKISHYKGN